VRNGAGLAPGRTRPERSTDILSPSILSGPEHVVKLLTFFEAWSKHFGEPFAASRGAPDGRQQGLARPEQVSKLLAPAPVRRGGASGACHGIWPAARGRDDTFGTLRAAAGRLRLVPDPLVSSGPAGGDLRCSPAARGYVGTVGQASLRTRRRSRPAGAGSGAPTPRPSSYGFAAPREEDEGRVALREPRRPFLARARGARVVGPGRGVARPRA